MSEQEFGIKLFNAATQAINLAGTAHCLTCANENEAVAKSWLNPAICELAERLESLYEELSELEEVYHKAGKFKYPVELNSLSLRSDKNIKAKVH